MLKGMIRLPLIVFVSFLQLFFLPEARSEAELGARVSESDSRENKQHAWGRGPFGIRDQFPLALLKPGFRAESPEVLGEHNSLIRGNFILTNTINRKDRNYLIDSESRVLELELARGLTERFQVGLSLPIIWRGGGVFDSAIFEWHKLLSLPQGPRDDDDIEDDEFKIEARTEDSERIGLETSGTRFGNALLMGKYLLTAGEPSSAPALSLRTELMLPSGADQYAVDGTMLGVNLDLSRRFEDFLLYGSVGYSYASDSSEHGFGFEQNRFAGAVSLEWEWCDSSSLILGVTVLNQLLDNVRHFPNYQIYLDTGIVFDISAHSTLELVLRENPAPDQGTADVSLMLGIEYRL